MEEITHHNTEVRLASGNQILSILQRITLPCNNSAVTVCRAGQARLRNSMKQMACTSSFALVASQGLRYVSWTHSWLHAVSNISADLLTPTCIACAWRMHIRAPLP